MTSRSYSLHPTPYTSNMISSSCSPSPVPQQHEALQLDRIRSIKVTVSSRCVLYTITIFVGALLDQGNMCRVHRPAHLFLAGRVRIPMYRASSEESSLLGSFKLRNVGIATPDGSSVRSQSLYCEHRGSADNATNFVSLSFSACAGVVSVARHSR
jgi:hypothetical protein